jgi:hypothetical protein
MVPGSEKLVSTKSIAPTATATMLKYLQSDLSSLEMDNEIYPKLVIAVASYLCHPLT